MEQNQITLDVETIQAIIEKLEELQEVELLSFTDWYEPKGSEDRLAFGKGYVECGNLITYLKEKLR